jgi:DNA-binding transcriptional LysR family regulator
VGFYIGDPAIDEPRDATRFYVVQLKPYLYRVLAPAGWKDRVNRATHPKTGAPDWAALARLPWIWTPAESAHNRLLTRLFDAHGVQPMKVAEVDQEPSMLDLVKSGVGLTLVRDSIALAEAHAHALTIVEGVTVPTQLSFIVLAERREEPGIAAALRLIEDQWAT